MLSQVYGRHREKVTEYFAVLFQSGRGLPHSQTLARRWGASLHARRRGRPGRARWQPAARRGLRALPALSPHQSAAAANSSGTETLSGLNRRRLVLRNYFPAANPSGGRKLISYAGNPLYFENIYCASRNFK
jgi:hypothetical protein